MAIEFTEAHLTAITQIDERCKSNTHRLDDAESEIKDLKEKNNALYEMSASIKNLSEGIATVKTDVREIRVEQGQMKEDITDLKNSPMKSKSKAWDSAWKFIITAVATGLVSFVLGQVAPRIFS